MRPVVIRLIAVSIPATHAGVLQLLRESDPERPSRRDAVISCWLLPMLETMPVPVITARFPFINSVIRTIFKFRLAQ